MQRSRMPELLPERAPMRRLHPQRNRVLVSFTETEWDQLITESARRGLSLATYLRALVLTHPERKGA